jgi:hypothetical protein
MSSLCIDCGIDTCPCSGKHGYRHVGRWEHYMVKDALWKRAGLTPDAGYLCIGCLEARLGRELRPSDFKDVILNRPGNPWHTPRLASRLMKRGA